MEYHIVLYLNHNPKNENLQNNAPWNLLVTQFFTFQHTFKRRIWPCVISLACNNSNISKHGIWIVAFINDSGTIATTSVFIITDCILKLRRFWATLEQINQYFIKYMTTVYRRILCIMLSSILQINNTKNVNSANIMKYNTFNQPFNCLCYFSFLNPKRF